MSNQHPYLEELNAQQRQAVQYLHGPQLVIAGAGSGKTRVLTYKIVHLLANGYEPWRILALTFTNKAAREMKERIEKLSGQSTASRINMGTFHSVFARLLRASADRIGYNRNFTIYDSPDSRNLIKTLVKDAGLDDKVYKPALLANAFSTAKNLLVSPEEYLRDPELMHRDARMQRPFTGQLYRAYCHRCKVAGAMDFDDLLFNMHRLLRDNPDVLRHYREFFRYILVDEYQDTNYAQHRIMTMLTGEKGNVCMVGDDAQSIYSFRGADITNILNLKADYPDLQIFKLEQNYRSSENIINSAGSLIEKNIGQIPKKVFSKNGAGEKVEIIKCYSDYEEAALVASRIVLMKRVQGDSFDDYVILYRTNAQSRVLEESLRERSVPYRIVGSHGFYERKEVKDIIAYLRMTANPHDDEAFRRIVNFPTRGIGETTLKKLTKAALESNRSLWQVAFEPASAGLNAATQKKLDAFTGMINGFVALDTAGTPIDQIVREIYIRTKILELYRSDNAPENITRYQNLQEFLNSAAVFAADSIEQGQSATLADFMSHVSLSTNENAAEEDDIPKVSMMTIHAAKGLEFSNVFVVGVEEDLLPSSMGEGSPKEIEEERRLMYVAITRAKSKCILSYASSRYRNGMTSMASPSRFLREIDTRYVKYMTGSETDDMSSSKPPSAFQPLLSRTLTRRTQQTPGNRQDKECHTRQSLPSSALPPQKNIGFGTLHNAAELSTGMKIEHMRFGKGIISSIDANNPTGERITVTFGHSEIKTLLLKFAKFTITG